MESLASAAVIATATVLTIVATDLTGNPSLAGVPSAVIQLSMAVFALIWGSLWDRLGRRNGLTAALLLGLAGAGLAAAGTELGLVWAFFLGIAGFGAMRAGTLMSRFVAAEVSAPDMRGRAISIVVWAGTVGAILGPLLVAPSSSWAVSLGLNELTRADLGRSSAHRPLEHRDLYRPATGAVKAREIDRKRESPARDYERRHSVPHTIDSLARRLCSGDHGRAGTSGDDHADGHYRALHERPRPFPG